ncbi:hypothetical protein [Nocardia sp. NPDC005366]|uniref:toxin-antitoxin system YwqK family antitoxin n=1 Tax=Nocardia sp. NPDC005366 TaxID=3156878 RepID=UPI00339F2230
MTTLPVETTDADLARDESAGLAWYQGTPFTGDVVEFDDDGGLLEYSTYVNGVLEGSSSHWYPGGAERASRRYERGLPIGTWDEWYPDGQRKQREIYSDSGRLRLRARWSESGDVLEETDRERWDKGIDGDAVLVGDPRLSTIQDGSRVLFDGEPFHGQMIERAGGDPDGVIVRLDTYLDGFGTGPSRGWYITDRRRHLGATERNRGIGLWLRWFPDGSPQKMTVLGADGSTLAQRVWDEAGGSLTDIPVIAADALEQRYRPDGSLEAIGVVTASGPIGTWVHWDIDGNLVREECFDSAGKQVSSLQWDAAGNRIEC